MQTVVNKYKKGLSLDGCLVWDLMCLMSCLVRYNVLRIFLLISIIFISFINSLGQTTIWSEDFDSYADETISGQGAPSVTTWNTDGFRDNQIGPQVRNVGVYVQDNQLLGRNTAYGNPA